MNHAPARARRKVVIVSAVFLAGLAAWAMIGLGFPASRAAGLNKVERRAEFELNGEKRLLAAGTVNGLVLVEPSSGMVVAPGQTVRVTAEAINGFKPHEGVALTCGGQIEKITPPPYTVTFTVPMEELGDLTVGAFAFDKDRYLASPPPIHLTVQTSSAIVSLTIRPEIVGVGLGSNNRIVQVDARFADGAEREITPDLMKIEFAVADPEIATIDAAGRVFPKKPGKTKVIVRCAGQTTEADLWVHDN